MAFNRLLGNLATDLDSAASGTFLSKDDATSADFTSIAYSDLTGTPTALDSALTTQLIDSSYIQLRQAEAAVAGIDSAAALVLFDSDYIGTRTVTTTTGFKEYQYTATSGQTVFKDSDKNGEVLDYGSGGILVFYNGILMRNGSTRDYTQQTNQITLNAAADSGANVSIAKWQVNETPVNFTWGGNRGLFLGGRTGSSSLTNVIDYVDIASPGNATDFGDLTQNKYGNCAFGDKTKVCEAGGASASLTSATNVISYVTVATTGNATDFGDLLGYQRLNMDCGSSDGIRGLKTGGYNGGSSNVIQYVTIASPGNATDFGDMSFSDYQLTAVNDATYSVAGGGASFENKLEYVTIQSAGNSTDFGDFSTTGRRNCAGLSDSTRGVFVGGNVNGSTSNIIDYITIANPANATNFGDLSTAGHKHGGQSNGTTGIFAGTGYVNEINQISIQTTGNATDFGDLSTSRADGAAGASGSPS